jgi:stress 70 protein chaperone microsome-associated 60kDa protein
MPNVSSMSLYFISGDAVYVGYEAVAQADHNPTNTLYDAKRFIGKQFTPEEFHAETQRYPFKVISVIT